MVACVRSVLNFKRETQMEIYRRPGGEYKSTAAVVFPKFIYLFIGRGGFLNSDFTWNLESPGRLSRAEEEEKVDKPPSHPQLAPCCCCCCAVVLVIGSQHKSQQYMYVRPRRMACGVLEWHGSRWRRPRQTIPIQNPILAIKSFSASIERSRLDGLQILLFSPLFPISFHLWLSEIIIYDLNWALNNIFMIVVVVFIQIKDKKKVESFHLSFCLTMARNLFI